MMASSGNDRETGSFRRGHKLALSKSRGRSKERLFWHALMALNMFGPGY
jgi:hypothetical protein